MGARRKSRWEKGKRTKEAKKKREKEGEVVRRRRTGETKWRDKAPTPQAARSGVGSAASL